MSNLVLKIFQGIAAQESAIKSIAHLVVNRILGRAARAKTACIRFRISRQVNVFLEVIRRLTVTCTEATVLA